MNSNNFKIKVKQNIGEYSKIMFGEIGTEFEVKNGILIDLEDFTWTNVGDYYKNIDDVNKCFSRYEYQTLFELVEDNTYKQFTKDDLKDGMVVELRNGEKLLVLNNSLVTNNGYIPMGEYNNNLTCDNDYDVVKVYKTNVNCLSDILDNAYLDLIWERKEEPKEMTVEEIEKALGYSIKIVK